MEKLSGTPGSFVRIEAVDPRTLDKIQVFRLMREDFARIAGANQGRLPLIFPKVVIEGRRQGRPFPFNQEEIVGTFSGIDKGAAEEIRSKFVGAGIPFRFADDGTGSVSVANSSASEARTLLLQLQSKGHWSIIIVSGNK